MRPSFPIARIRRYRETIPDRLLVVAATAILSALLSVAIFSPAGDPGLPIAVGVAGALVLISILSGIGRFAGLFAVAAVAIGAWDIFIGYGLGSAHCRRCIRQLASRWPSAQIESHRGIESIPRFF